MIIGLLTGRAGSKDQSLPFKNTYPLLGKPLMLYPYFAALESKYINDIYLSTNGPELKEIANNNSIKIIDRPDEYARSDSQHNECIQHALDKLINDGIDVEIIVILMCNVAIQPSGIIDKCIQALIEDSSLDSAVTVREWGDHHPSRAKILDQNELLKPLLSEKKTNVTTTRQLLGDCYYLDHHVWAFRVRNGKLKSKGQGPWYWMGDKIRAIKNKELVIDVHSLEDIKYSELWLKTNKTWKEDYDL